MKKLILLLQLILMISFSTSLTAQNESQEWDLEEYQSIWEKHQKIYVYANGDFIVTNKELKDSKDVVLLYLKEDNKKLKTGKGKLSKELIKNKLSKLTPFNPSKAALETPCCPIRDNKGNLLYYGYSNDCPRPCKKPFKLTSGTNVQINCCPPNFLGYLKLNPM